MTVDRYNRWQGLAINQLSVAVALISGLSISCLAFGFSLIQNKEFVPIGAFKVIFAWSFPFFLLAALFSFFAVVSRMMDFRLTARKVRQDKKPTYSRPLKIFWLGSDAYGRITWVLFWFSCIALVIGIVSLFASVWITYANPL